MKTAPLKKPQPVPHQYSGKWIVRSVDGLQILGVGDTPHEARRNAESKGHYEVAYEWVPPADKGFIGNIGL